MKEAVRNPSAYAAAIERRIKQNAAITRRRQWEAGNPDHERLNAWLNQVGEFRSVCTCGQSDAEHRDQYGGCWAELSDQCRDVPHPATRGIFSGDFGSFLLKLADQLNESGGLSDSQTTVVRNALARTEQRIAERAAQREAQRAADATKAHVGAVGERRNFTLRVERVMSFESQYGVTFINLCRDADDNIIVYKGSNGWEAGEQLTVKATIKEHGVYNGAPQTLIQRPTVIK